MKSREPLYVHFYDNEPTIYRCTKKQFETLLGSGALDALEIDSLHDNGYAPGWLAALADELGFEVGSE